MNDYNNWYFNYHSLKYSWCSFWVYDLTIIVCSAWYVNEASELLIWNVYYFTVNTCTYNIHIIMEWMDNQEFLNRFHELFTIIWRFMVRRGLIIFRIITVHRLWQFWQVGVGGIFQNIGYSNKVPCWFFFNKHWKYKGMLGPRVYFLQPFWNGHKGSYNVCTFYWF